MPKFFTKYNLPKRTVEHCAGPYQVCLEGFFDFNEAIAKLMQQNMFFPPDSSQYEPGSDDYSDDDFISPENSFDDVCDAISLGREVASRLSEPSEPQKEVSKARKPKSDDNSLDDLPEGPLDPEAVSPHGV